MVKSLPVSKIPKRYIFDLAAKCNLRCGMCPVWGSEENSAIEEVKGVMNIESSRKILDEIMNVKPMIHPNLYGEPLLAPKFRERIIDMKERDIAVAINTNGLALTTEIAKFFVDIKLNNGIVTAHCPNTGSMMGLLNKNSNAWISKSDNPKRKLKYTLEILEIKNNLFGVNTHRANRIVEDSLKKKHIKEFKSVKLIKPEFKFDSETRFDFLCDKKIIEVKNVTLLRNDTIAEFPDAVTSRGSKHLIKLIESIKKGFFPNVLFLTQIQDIKYFKIAKDIDENYYKNYLLAKKAGVNFLAYNCKLSSKEIKIEKKIKIIDEQ